MGGYYPPVQRGPQTKGVGTWLSHRERQGGYGVAAGVTIKNLRRSVLLRRFGSVCVYRFPIISMAVSRRVSKAPGTNLPLTVS